MGDLFIFHENSFGKVPSPTFSDDSGLELSPICLESDGKFMMESPELASDLSDMMIGGENAEEIFKDLTYNNNLGSDLGISLNESYSSEKVSIFDSVTEPALIKASNTVTSYAVGKETEKLPSVKKNKPTAKKRPSIRDPAVFSSKLERCLLPKTGNAKPRQASKKNMRSTNKKGVYSGVRPKTVKEQLIAIRKGRIKSTAAPTNPPVTPQSLTQPCYQVPQIHPSPTCIGYTQPTTSNMHPLPTSTFPIASTQIHFSNSSTFLDDLTLEPSTTLLEPQTTIEKFYSQPEQTTYVSSNYEPTITSNPYYELPQQQHSSINPIFQCPAYTQAPSVAFPEHFPDVNPPTSRPFLDSIHSQQYQQQTNMEVPCPSIPQYFLQQCGDEEYYDGLSLHYSAIYGDVAQVRNCIENRGSDVNLKDEENMTALTYAVKNGRQETVIALLNYGADPMIITQERYNILHLASQQPAQMMSCLMKTLRHEQVKKLIDNRAGCVGHTPLHMATEAGNVETMLILLRNGASVTSQEQSAGLTSLHLAIKSGNITAVSTLLNYVAGDQDVEKIKEVVRQVTYDDNTALHFAAELHKNATLCHSSGSVTDIQHQLIDMLLLHHADPAAKNRNHQLPAQFLPSGSTELLGRLRASRRLCSSRVLDFNAPPLHQRYGGTSRSQGHQ